MLEAVGFPVAVNPETRLAALARKRGLAGRALRQGRRARRRPLLPDRPRVGAGDAAPAASARSTPLERAAMKALVFERKPAEVRRRHGGRRGSRPGGGATVGPLSLARRRPARAARPGLGAHPAPARRHLRLATSPPSTARSSRYFEPIVSFPFMPGHEVVGDLDDGTRVVVVPVLSCVARGIAPVVRRVRRGPHQPLRAHRASATSSRPADAASARHRRRLVDR